MPEPFTLSIPSQDWDGGGEDMLSRLARWEWRVPAGRDAMRLDFSGTRFIEPWAIAMFVAHALHLKATLGIHVEAVMDEARPSNAYLLQMGLPNVLANERSTEEWDDSHQNTGLHLIRQHADVTRFVSSLKALDLSPVSDTADALQYCVLELGRNVVQHAASPSGGVAMAQVFPARRAVQITVSDRGQGILSALGETHPELRNDLEALKAAVLPHVSGAFPSGTYSASENAGLGLFFTKEIAWRSSGTFFLVSGDHMLSERAGVESGSSRRYRSIMPWGGTSVTLDLPLDGTPDFAGLLELCRQLSRAARRSPGEAGLDFLREVPDLADLPRIRIQPFSEDVEQAVRIRDDVLLPAVKEGKMVLLDFEGVRFATQSFVHALLNDVLRETGSLTRVSFVNCTRSTEEAIRAVAAYAATYRLCV